MNGWLEYHDALLAYDELKSIATINWHWDVGRYTGFTWKEITENLYLTLLNMADLIYGEVKVERPNFIVTSPEISSLFEISSSTLSPLNGLIYEKGFKFVKMVGGWRLYKEDSIKDEILMGINSSGLITRFYGDKPFNPLEYGLLKIQNLSI